PSEADRLLGDLAQIAKQMEESIKEMTQRNVDTRTVRRQQEILTRLLNASKSIRERGRENRREGQTGEEIKRASPSELPPDERAEQLRRELLDALETGYSADFEELIRRYFELLQEQEAGQD
ncbi:MAG: chromosome partitioning protein ParA, partial [Candidatus Latescibacterota bacterium]